MPNSCRNWLGVSRALCFWASGDGSRFNELEPLRTRSLRSVWGTDDHDRDLNRVSFDDAAVSIHRKVSKVFSTLQLAVSPGGRAGDSEATLAM